MPQNWVDEDEDDRDPEGPDESDIVDDDPTYIPCPYCGKPIVEDAEQCFHCRMYITQEDDDVIGHPTKSPAWILITGAIVILGIFIIYLMGVLRP